MSFTSATFCVHKKFQSIFPAPYYIDTKINRLIPNPYFRLKTQKTYRWIAITSYTLCLPLILFRLSYIFFRWETFPKKPLDEAAFHAMFVCGIIILLTNVYVIFTSSNEIQYLSAANLKKLNTKKFDSENYISRN